MASVQYELFRSRYRVSEWKGDAVFRTEFLDTDWFGMEEVQHNKPAKTNVIYSSPTSCKNSDEHRGIRLKSKT